jgi:single-strand DNA-binding protein
MARGLNKAMIVGFVEREPEKRYTSRGQAVTSFAVSTSRRWMTSAGEARESSDWFQVVAWGKLAEIASQRLHRSRRIFAEGHLQTRSWDDSGGHRRFRTEIVATRLIPMDEREAIPLAGCENEYQECPLCLNQAMVIGNLGRDPEMRYTLDGQAVTSFSLAATRTWITASGEKHDRTEWFNVVSWGSLAEICNQVLRKGRRVYVEGELRTHGWEQPDGRKHFGTELVASEMIMLGPRPPVGGAEGSPGPDNDDFPL